MRMSPVLKTSSMVSEVKEVSLDELSSVNEVTEQSIELTPAQVRRHTPPSLPPKPKVLTKPVKPIKPPKPVNRNPAVKPVKPTKPIKPPKRISVSSSSSHSVSSQVTESMLSPRSEWVYRYKFIYVTGFPNGMLRVWNVFVKKESIQCLLHSQLHSPELADLHKKTQGWIVPKIEWQMIHSQ